APVLSSHRLLTLRALHSFPTRRSSDLGSPAPSWILTVPLLPVSRLADTPMAPGPRMATAIIIRTASQASRRVVGIPGPTFGAPRSEEHTSEPQSRFDLVCRLLLEKKKH